MKRRNFISDLGKTSLLWTCLGSQELNKAFQSHIIFPSSFSNAEREHVMHYYKEVAYTEKQDYTRRELADRLFIPKREISRKKLPCGGYETCYENRLGQKVIIRLQKDVQQTIFA